MIASFDDDRRHREAMALGMSKRLTACGLEVWDEGPVDGLACHICLPHEAHPLESVWRTCERWDADVNASAERTNMSSIGESRRSTIGVENLRGGRAASTAVPRPTPSPQEST